MAPDDSNLPHRLEAALTAAGDIAYDWDLTTDVIAWHGSVAAMLVGNNTSSSFSEGDLIRERVAQNIGNAGDSEVLGLSANSRVVVSVPADTKIYIVFTKHEPSSSTLHKLVR